MRPLLPQLAGPAARAAGMSWAVPDLAAAFDAYADAVIPALAGHWRSAPG